MPIESIQNLPDGVKEIFESVMSGLKGKTNPRTGKEYTDEERGKISWSAVKRKYKKSGDGWVLKNMGINSQTLSLNYAEAEDNGPYTTYKGITLTTEGVMNNGFKSNAEIQKMELPDFFIIYLDHVNDEIPLEHQYLDYQRRLGYGFGNNKQIVFNVEKEKYEVKYDLNYFNGELAGFDVNKYILVTNKIEVSIEYDRDIEKLPDEKQFEYNGKKVTYLEKNMKMYNAVHLLSQKPACKIEDGCGSLLNTNQDKSSLIQNQEVKKEDMDSNIEKPISQNKICDCKDDKTNLRNQEVKSVIETKKTTTKNSDGGIIETTEVSEEVIPKKEVELLETGYKTRISELETQLSVKDTELTDAKNKIAEYEVGHNKWKEYETRKNAEYITKILEIDSDQNKEKLEKNNVCQNKEKYEEILRLKEKFGTNKDTKTYPGIPHPEPNSDWKVAGKNKRHDLIKKMNKGE